MFPLDYNWLRQCLQLPGLSSSEDEREDLMKGGGVLVGSV